MRITVTMTAAELIDRDAWSGACDLLGMNPFAVMGGLMDREREITMTEAQAWKLGLVPYRPGLESDPSLTANPLPLEDDSRWHAGWEAVERDQIGNLILRYVPSGGLYRVVPVEDGR